MHKIGQNMEGNENKLKVVKSGFGQTFIWYTTFP